MRLDVIADGLDGGEGVSRDIGVWYGDAEVLFQGDDQLERIDGIQPQALGAEEGEIVGNLFPGGPEHEVFDHHILDRLFQLVAGHCGEEVNQLKRSQAQAIILV